MNANMHNKMYREIEGYEDALYAVGDIIDECEELRDKLEYGKSLELVLEHIKKIETYLKSIRLCVK